MKWLLVLMTDDSVVLNRSPHIYHESKEQAKEDLIEQFDELFNEYREMEDEGISESGEDSPNESES